MKKKKKKINSFTLEEKELVDLLFEKVELVTGFSKGDLVTKCRDGDLVLARMIIANILRNEMHLSFSKTGIILCKHHATIMYYVKEHENNLVYPPYNRMYFDIYDRIVHKVKRTDVEAIDKEIERAQARLNNLKHKRKLIIWATRRYESSEV
jgi:hypothetical protein